MLQVMIEALRLDEDTILQTDRLVRAHSKPSALETESILWNAAAAVICEERVIQSVQNVQNATAKIRMEQIMAFLSKKAQKMQFLSILPIIHRIYQQEKIEESCSQIMEKKIKLFSLSYQQFLAYETTFHSLIQPYKYSKEHCKVWFQIIWLLFVEEKYRKINEGKQKESLLALISLLEIFFTEWFKVFCPSTFLQQIKNNFNLPPLPRLQYAHYKQKFTKRLHSVLSARRFSLIISTYGDNIQNWKKLKRICDDLYQSLCSQFPDPLILQTSFLDVQKDLTPQKIILSQESEDCPPPQQVLSFSNDLCKEQNENTCIRTIFAQQSYLSEPLRLQRQRIQNPVAMERIYYLKWLNSRLLTINEKQTHSLKQIFKQSFQGQYNEFQKRITHSLQQSIRILTPCCIDRSKRLLTLFKMFLYFLSKIIAPYSHSDLTNFIFAQKTKQENLQTILSLSTELTNKALGLDSIRYSQYFGIFKTNNILYLKFINGMGLNTDLPSSLQKYLFKVEKEILLKDLWNSEYAFELIVKEESKRDYAENAFCKRMKLHLVDNLTVMGLKGLFEMRLFIRVKERLIHKFERQQHQFRNQSVENILQKCIDQIQNQNEVERKLSNHRKHISRKEQLRRRIIQSNREANQR